MRIIVIFVLICILEHIYNVDAVKVNSNLSPLYSNWNSASYGWTGAKVGNVTIFIARNGTKLTFYRNNTASLDVTWWQSLFDSSSPLVPSPSGPLYFIGGNPTTAVKSHVQSWNADDSPCGTSGDIATLISPAVASIGTTLFAGGGTGAYSGAVITLPPSSETPCIPTVTPNPCNSTTPWYTPGYFSVGVSTSSAVLFTAGCLVEPQWDLQSWYSSYPCTSYSYNDVIMWKPSNGSLCPITSASGNGPNSVTFNLTVPRFRVGSAASSKYIVFAGGEDRAGTESNLVEVYSVQAIDSSTSLSPPVPIANRTLAQARRSPRVIVVNDTFFFIVGGDTKTGASGYVDVFDATDFSISAQTLAYPTSSPAVAEDPSQPNSILYVGGYDFSSAYLNRQSVYRVSAASDTTNTPVITAATPIPSVTSMTPTPSNQQSTVQTTSASSATPATPKTPSPTTPSSSSASPAPTTTAPPPPPPTASGGCVLPPPPSVNPVNCSNGVWIVSGNLSISTELNISSPIIVQGTLNITAGGVLRVQSLSGGQIPITVTNDASIQGVIELHVTNGTANVTVLTAKNVNGTFSGVTVISDDRSCKQGTIETSQTRVGVLVSGCKKSHKWLYVIVVAACVLVVAVVIIVGVIAMQKGWFKNLYRSRVKTVSNPHSASYNLLSDEKKL